MEMLNELSEMLAGAPSIDPAKAAALMNKITANDPPGTVAVKFPDAPPPSPVGVAAVNADLVTQAVREGKISRRVADEMGLGHLHPDQTKKSHWQQYECLFEIVDGVRSTTCCACQRVIDLTPCPGKAAYAAANPFVYQQRMQPGNNGPFSRNACTPLRYGTNPTFLGNGGERRPRQ
jgi:hypothetical protein